MDIEECMEKGFLSRIEPDIKLVDKELIEAEHDLSRAKSTLKMGDPKWATVQAYYSMFHAAKALLFSLGLKERRHFAVEIVLEELSKKGKLEAIHITNFSAAMEAREDADYKHFYSKERAENMIEDAGNFFKEMKSKSNNFILEYKNKVVK
jgi:uncharacterized protein (UPF0332 family)